MNSEITQSATTGSPLRARPERAFQNPYMRRTMEYPGKVFSPEDRPEDAGLIEATRTGFAESIAELGSGSGQHLIELAKRNPQAACFGFELRFKRVVRTMEKSFRHELPNLFVIRTDARSIGKFFPEGSLSAIYMNFPDPWEKRKQAKHRMFSGAFILPLTKFLKRGGALALKTDHPQAFGEFVHSVSEMSGIQLIESTTDLYNSEFAANTISTEFEELFRNQGLPINYAKLVKA